MVGVAVTFASNDSSRSAASAEATDISGSFPLVRVQSSTVCGSDGVPLSTYGKLSLRVDLLIPYAVPCASTPPGRGVSSTLKSLTCTSNGTVTSVGATCWAANAYTFYKRQCAGTNECPELEVLNEPGGSWFWGSGADTAGNASAYASLLKVTSEYFRQRLAASPKILASYDGGVSSSSSWGREVWNNDMGIDVSKYVDGVTFHPYSACTSPITLCTKPADSRATISGAWNAAAASGDRLPPVYVTEIGWNTNSANGWWTESQQASNYCSFVTWARQQPYMAQVIAYTYEDTGTKWFGSVRLDETSGGGGDLSHKPAWNALVQASRGQAC